MLYELKPLDCPVVQAERSPMLLSDGWLQMMRCVHEVARSKISNIAEWHVLMWSVG